MSLFLLYRFHGRPPSKTNMEKALRVTEVKHWEHVMCAATGSIGSLPARMWLQKGPHGC